MSDALRYEWTRIRTLRSTYWLIGIGLLVTSGIALIFALVAEDEDKNDPELIMAMLTGAANFGVPFLAVFVAIIGVFATGHEYRHGVIQPTLTTIPQRSTLLIAKIVVVLVTALVVVLVSLAIAALIGAVGLGGLQGLGESPLNEALPGYVIYVLLYALLGMALGQLFRGVPSALVVLFIVPLVVETLIIGLSSIEALDWLVPVVKFLPFSAGGMLMSTSEDVFGPDTAQYELFDRWAAGGIFAAFVAIILAVAWYLFKKRDA